MSTNRYISNIRVEGGFLDGLDLDLSAGLNVIVGGRGTGKTSIIELLRFCFGTESLTKDSARRVNEQVNWILRDGEVTITFDDDSQLRRIIDSSNPSTYQGTQPLILSQTEVETIGMSSTDRLKLIDEFSQKELGSKEEYESAITRVRSLTKEISSLKEESSSYGAELDEKQDVVIRLSKQIAEQAELADKSKAMAEKRDELDVVDENLSEYEHIRINLGVVNQQSIGADLQIETLLTSFESITTRLGSDSARLKPVRQKASKVLEYLGKAKAEHRELLDLVAQTTDEYTQLVNDSLRKASELRRVIEGFKSGAGDLSRAISQDRARLSRFQDLEEDLARLQKKIAGRVKERDAALDTIDLYRSQRRDMRVEVAKNLTKALSPKIRVSIIGEARSQQYEEALADSLRGTRIWANIVPAITANVSPRELIRAVEENQEEFITERCEISPSRASRLIGALAERNNLSRILLADIEDDISLELLDGGDYKPVEHLSTGQRCTVVLPILFEQSGRLLVIDQPEDHLDNAFVADTLVGAIVRRKKTDQMVITTHNPNIPVLGECENTIVLGSDGRRGFVRASGNIDDPAIVTNIVRIMEGGEEAFSRRALKYRDHMNL